MSSSPQVQDDGDKAEVDGVLHLDQLQKLLEDVVNELPDQLADKFENIDGMLEGYLR